MTNVQQELMTSKEAARWFRRSVSWLRRQPHLIRHAGPGGHPLYHLAVCRAFVLGKMGGANGAELRRLQITAFARACGLSEQEATARLSLMAACESDSPRMSSKVEHSAEI